MLSKSGEEDDVVDAVVGLGGLGYPGAPLDMEGEGSGLDRDVLGWVGRACRTVPTRLISEILRLGDSQSHKLS